MVAGAKPPGQTKPAAPTAPTQRMDRYPATEPKALAARAPAVPRPSTARSPHQRRGSQRLPGRSRAGRFVTALVALALLLAVPVVSAYVAYKLAIGDNPFEWPPTVDYDKIFGR